jgi:hypothetical protein
MNKDVKALWLDALRSGEYSQATGMLRKSKDDSFCFCALGVLADLAIKTGGVGEWTYLPGYGWAHRVETVDSDGIPDWDETVAVPAPKAMEWADMPYTVAEGIWFLNDGEKKSFSEIADYIEENL